MHERRLARIYKVISTLLLFQVGENWVSKHDKSKNGFQRSQESMKTKKKRCYDGLHDFFLFFYELSGLNFYYFKREK